MAGTETARISVATDRYADQYIGMLDDLRVYNYALSKALYDGQGLGPGGKKDEPPR
ncbi:MAG: hypothetical protein ACYS9T_00765 [Planctomycetota bacterium]|jgi:hypothetical protein